MSGTAPDREGARRDPPLLPAVRGARPHPRRAYTSGEERGDCVRYSACRDSAALRQWPALSCSACPVPPGATDFDVREELRKILIRREETERALARLRVDLAGVESEETIDAIYEPIAPKNETAGEPAGKESGEMTPRWKNGKKRVFIEDLDENCQALLRRAVAEGRGARETRRALLELLPAKETPSLTGVASYLRRAAARRGKEPKTPKPPAIVDDVDTPATLRARREKRGEISEFVETVFPAARERVERFAAPIEVRPDGTILCPDAATAVRVSAELRRLNDLAALGAAVEAEATAREGGRDAER